jgi:hypothetical protein
MVTDGLAVLCQADASGLDEAVMAELLLVLEQADAMTAAARASILGAFTANLGYESDGHAGAVAWLMDRAQATKNRAKTQVKQGKKLRAHRQVAAAMAGGAIMGSWADKIMDWTGRLPADSRENADEILLGAAAGGARLEDLAALACQMYELSKADQPDDDGPDLPDDPEAAAFADRSVKIETTLDGAGTLYGELSPEATGLLATVLDALSVRAGNEDDRTRGQRYHDGLAEACRRLIAAGLLPQRAGQPTKAVVHIPLGQLRQMDGASVFEQGWRDWAAAEWAAHRGAASVLGSDGAVWLDGAAAEAAGCDAMMVPVVFASIDWQALDHMVDQCAELRGIRHGGDAAGQDAREARAAELRNSILGTILDVVSGPGAAASVLRTGLLGGNPLGSPSQVLDIGYSEEIPAAIRRAVILRDRHCAFGKCDAPPASCEVHHIIHKEDGGITSVSNCVLICWFHHQVMIHRMGWMIRLLADGTTEATSPAGKTVRSHGPPARAG